jgi:ribose 5-phosphate isomerase B
MKKREFIKKTAILSASMLGASSAAFANKSSRDINYSEEKHFTKNEYFVVKRNIDALPMKLVIGSDHAGFPMKDPLISLLHSWKHIVKDVGSFTPDPVDFPDIALLLAEEILNGRYERGIMVCGTGVGAAIACNKIHGIRAALCHDTYSAHQCVEHDNVNIICLGAQIIGISLAGEILSSFLNAKFSTEEQFRRRVQKLDQFDLVPQKAK